MSGGGPLEIWHMHDHIETSLVTMHSLDRRAFANVRALCDLVNGYTISPKLVRSCKRSCDLVDSPAFLPTVVQSYLLTLLRSCQSLCDRDNALTKPFKAQASLPTLMQS